MRIAIVGSRNVTIDTIAEFVADHDEIISGGAVGVDQCAADYARSHGLKLPEFLPEYGKYGRAAPIIRNRQIVDHADKVIVFWDGKSKGTLSVIKYAEKVGKSCEIILCRQ